MGYSEQTAQMCTHMGAGAPGFTERALDFHHTADTITAAARQHDDAAVMRALGSTLETCTGCHAAFRQSVVTRRLGIASPPCRLRAGTRRALEPGRSDSSP
jgi:hypothetical protein